MSYRIFASVLILISIFFLPLWVSVILGVLSMLYFNFFFEVVVLFLIMDLFFGIPEVKFANVPFVGGLLILIVLISLEYLKKRLKFYNKLN